MFTRESSGVMFASESSASCGLACGWTIPQKVANSKTQQESLMCDAEIVFGEPHNLVSWTFSGIYNGDKPVLIDAHNPNRTISKNQAMRMVASWTEAWPAGSTVCIHMANDIVYPILVLAILASGCTWTGTNLAYKAPELEHHFRISGTKYVLTTADQHRLVSKAAEDGGTKITIILCDDLLDPSDEDPAQISNAVPSQNISDFARIRTPQAFSTAVKSVSRHTPAALMQTSGTTGLPKMAIRTHEAMVLELQAIQDNNNDKPYEVRRLFSTPIFHAFSAPEMIYNSLFRGDSTYFMKRFDNTFAQKVHEFQITETFGAPPMLALLVKRVTSSEDDPKLLHSLRMVAYGGAILAPEDRQKFVDIFDGAPPRLMPVYGSTEGGWFTSMKYPEVDSTGSIGRLLPGCEAKFNSSPEMQQHFGRGLGEIMVRSNHVMTEYRHNAKATEKAFDGGWLRTGDVGYIKDGLVYFEDRLKDLIKCSGWQVAPAELENALLTCADVQDAAVFGVGEGDKEHPVAWVVVDSPTATAEGIKAYLGTRVASYKAKYCQIKIVADIPKSPAGKMLKKDMRDTMVRAGEI